jgi:hypothetical protein
MDRFQESNAFIIVALSVLACLLSYYFLRSDAEAAIPYDVPPPKQAMPGWKGEVLEKPKLKVCVFEAQNYF